MEHIMDPATRENGFKSYNDMSTLICKVDISTPLNMSNFKLWQYDDGSRTGLLELINTQGK